MSDKYVAGYSFESFFDTGVAKVACWFTIAETLSGGKINGILSLFFQTQCFEIRIFNG
jgi:hypothetical protein